MNQGYYSIHEIARMLGVSVKQARKLLLTREIANQQHRLSGYWKVCQNDIDQYLKIQKASLAKSGKPIQRVLIVDDDKNIVNLIHCILKGKMSHLIIESCHDGFEALKLIGKKLPDLLVLDNRMPKTIGMHVLHAIRKNPRKKDIKILAVVGHPSDQEEMMELGADDSIKKPFSASLLILKAKQLLLKKPGASVTDPDL